MNAALHTPADSMRVRGGASAEEVVAILAALHRVTPHEQPGGYERWRSARLAALKAQPVD
jgi:hypothetical protein